MKRKIGSPLKLVAFWIGATTLLLLLAEGTLRLAGYPKGRFLSLYPPHARIQMTWGPIPYTIETNAFGLRSREVTYRRPPGRTRILMIGDSITDGFFADNPDTYPWRLDDLLRRRGADAEVINAGMGGGSIDKSFAVLTSTIKLRPDLVILTFVTNDISEIRGKRAEDLVAVPRGNQSLPAAQTLPRMQRAVQWLLIHTATAEAVFDLSLRVRFRSYRSAERNGAAAHRYQIAGGVDHEANVAEFLKRYAKTDGLVLETPLSEETRRLIANYVSALDRVNAYCGERGARLVFVYFPCYVQIYDAPASLQVRDILAEACAAAGIPFLDTTERFRSEGARKVLHLAPIDFHLNPDGYEVLAEAVAAGLVDRGLVKVRVQPAP